MFWIAVATSSSSQSTSCELLTARFDFGVFSFRGWWMSFPRLICLMWCHPRSRFVPLQRSLHRRQRKDSECVVTQKEVLDKLLDQTSVTHNRVPWFVSCWNDRRIARPVRLRSSVCAISNLLFVDSPADVRSLCLNSSS